MNVKAASLSLPIITGLMSMSLLVGCDDDEGPLDDAANQQDRDEAVRELQDRLNDAEERWDEISAETEDISDERREEIEEQMDQLEQRLEEMRSGGEDQIDRLRQEIANGLDELEGGLDELESEIEPEGRRRVVVSAVNRDRADKPRCF